MKPWFRSNVRRLALQLGPLALCSLLVCFAFPLRASAQDSPSGTSGSADKTVQTDKTQSQDTPNPPPSSDEPTPGDPVTLFPHSESSRYWISGQANIVFQWHPTFPARYSGPNSLSAQAQSATTHILTLYTGYELTPTTEVFLDIEDATGGGIGNALGLAGYTDLDSVRTANGVVLSKAPYLARLMLRQIIPLGSQRVEAERDPLHLATSVPARRIEIRFGKFDLVDFFDVNTWGSDSHLQFLNWTADNLGAYDYAANTRGYTDGALLEYDDHWFTARFAESLMPKVANGINLDADIARAREEALEFEFRQHLIAKQRGVVRFLSYLNHANMGSYEEAIRNFEKGKAGLAPPIPVPNIVSTRVQGRHKYGFGLNLEEEITPRFGVFSRLGWSDGRNESFAYTECDRTLDLGAFAAGENWHRRNDRAGVAFIANGIVKAHQQYLALGGVGFLLGDGNLTYGPEKIFEAFYTLHVWRGFFTSFDLQHINNPGYNQDRGPVTVPTLRLHVDF